MRWTCQMGKGRRIKNVAPAPAGGKMSIQDAIYLSATPKAVAADPLGLKKDHSALPKKSKRRYKD